MSAQLSNHVLKNHDRFVEGINTVASVEADLQVMIINCWTLLHIVEYCCLGTVAVVLVSSIPSLESCVLMIMHSIDQLRRICNSFNHRIVLNGNLHMSFFLDDMSFAFLACSQKRVISGM